MSKIYGLRKDFAPVREDRSRTIVSYGLQVEPDGEHATWNEVYFYKKKVGRPSKEQIKDAIIADIDERTVERITKGYEWTVLHGADEGRTVKVWLSMENQFNFKAACDKAVKKDGENLPVKFKLGQDANGNPVYHTFESVEELSAFVDQGEEYVHRCVTEGWDFKDSIDWSEYEI